MLKKLAFSGKRATGVPVHNYSLFMIHCSLIYDPRKTRKSLNRLLFSPF